MGDVSERTTHAQSSEEVLPYFLANGGEVGAIILSRDWRDSPIGPLLHWPPELKTIVPLLLQGSVQPIAAKSPPTPCSHRCAGALITEQSA